MKSNTVAIKLEFVIKLLNVRNQPSTNNYCLGDTECIKPKFDFVRCLACLELTAVGVCVVSLIILTTKLYMYTYADQTHKVHLVLWTAH